MNRRIRSMALSLLLSLTIMAGVIPIAGCNNASVVSNLQAVVSGSRDVVAAMSASDPRFEKAQKFVTDAQALLDAYKAAVASDPSGCVDVATLAADVVNAFQSAILPLLNVSPTIAAAIAGIDVALRLVVANLHTCIVKTAGGKVSKSVMKAESVSKAQAADGVFTLYLASPKIVK